MSANPHIQLVDAAPTPAVIMNVWAEKASDLMTTNLLTLDQDAPIRDAVFALGEDGPSGAPVLDEEQRLVGFISRTDLVGLMGRLFGGDRPRLESLTVGDIMTPAILCVTEQTGSATVIELMLREDVSRVFVIDGQERVIGVISAVDVLRNTQG